MNDHDPSDDLSAEHAEVRHLLADARHDEPMPDEVVARLDRVLAGLADEPARAAPVTQLATRRRRAAGLLLAAAAVVAIGVGVSKVVDTGTGSADSLSTADRAESGGDAGRTDGEAEKAPEEGAQEGGGAEAPEPANGSTSSEGQATTDSDTFVRLTRRQYGDEVAELRAQRSTGARDRADGLDASSAAGETCLSDAWGAGSFVPVRYEGAPAVLVFRRVRGDTQVADLFRCGDSEPHRSVTLPAP